MSCLPWSGFVPATIYGRHWGFSGVFLEVRPELSGRLPQSLAYGLLTTVRRGDFGQSQLLLI